MIDDEDEGEGDEKGEYDVVPSEGSKEEDQLRENSGGSDICWCERSACARTVSVQG